MAVTSSPGGTPQSSADAAALAEAHGLRHTGIRPPFWVYVRAVWRRREFTRVLATSSAYAENQNTYLGQLWAVLNPVLNAAVYILIFGILLDITRGLENLIAFIVVGTFMYRFFSDSVSSSAKSVTGNISLVRSLQFPRAVLPISAVMAQFATLIPAVAVMVLIVLGSGVLPVAQPVTVGWEWLLLPVAVVMTYIFATGVGFVMARIVAGLPDIAKLLPFALRLGFYGSGVIFSIERFVRDEVLLAIMSYQPVAVYLNLARQTLLNEPTIPWRWELWLVGLGWAVLALVVGFWFFWRAEARYGRE